MESAPLSVVKVDPRGKTRLKVNELAMQDAILLDLTGPLRKKKAAEFKKLNDARKASRASKQTLVFETDAKDRFEDAVFELDWKAAGWSLENPPRMATLKTPGSGASKEMAPANWGNRKYWIDIVPTHKVWRKALRKLEDRYLSAYGHELDATFGNQFQEWGNPHAHVLLTVPMNADGTEMLSNHATGKGGRYAKFNGLRFWEWLELTWADILKIRSDITSPLEHGVATWLPRADEVEAADTMQDYFGKFVYYMRLDNEIKYDEKKRNQQKVPQQWAGQQVAFWGILGFTNKRRSPDAAVELECRTQAADNAARAFLARCAGEEVVVKIIDGVTVEVQYWSNQRDRLRGGVLNRPLTRAELRELRRIISICNKIEDVEPEYIEVPAYEQPDMRQLLIDSVESAISPWDHDDFDLDSYTAMDHQPVEVLPEIPLDDDALRPVAELLSLMGFSDAEQAKAAKTAYRAANKLKSKQFDFTRNQ